MKKILFIGLLFALACTEAWSQSRSDSARIYYRQGYRHVDPRYRDNRTELDRFIRLLREEYTAGRLEGVEIRSWASPEGVTRLNNRLSERRADSLKSYLVRHASIPDSLVSVRGEGIAWEMLREMVATTPDLPYQEEVLHILDHTPIYIYGPTGRIVDGRKKQLMDLRGGRPYNYMLEHIFPDLRTSLSVVCHRKPTPVVTEATSEPTEELLPEKEPIAEQPDTVVLHPQQPVPASDVAAEAEPTPRQPALPERLAIKTNLIYDAILMPSLEVEYRITDRWTVNLEGDVAWWSNDAKHKFYQIATISPEGRWWFGQKKASPWHGHYVGLFGSFSWYDLENTGRGYQGEAEMVGISYGYMFPIGKRLSLEAGIGVGYMHSKYEEYLPVPYLGGTHYVYQQTSRLNYFGPLKLKLNLVWRLWKAHKTKGGAR